METLLYTFCAAFLLMLGAALLIDRSKKRLQRTRHGLTGMCHHSGEHTCCGGKDDGSCGERGPHRKSLPVKILWVDVADSTAILL
jgi:hypothetical protein